MKIHIIINLKLKEEQRIQILANFKETQNKETQNKETHGHEGQSDKKQGQTQTIDTR